jgi:hypothetical protein
MQTGTATPGFELPFRRCCEIGAPNSGRRDRGPLTGGLACETTTRPRG